MSKKTMSLEPDWQSFFELAKNIVRTNINEDEGQALVIEMLDYGKRLDGLTPAQKAQRERRQSEREAAQKPQPSEEEETKWE